MKQTAKARIKRILQKHCVMTRAVFSRPVTDEFGDTVSREQYGEFDLYFSRLLHRYTPYIELGTDNDNIAPRRSTPMAILPYDEPLSINQGDIVNVKNIEYTVSACDDVSGYYYLLSLSVRE